KAVRLLTWKSSARIWAELHEQAFRRLGGVPQTIVLDNLKEGVLTPDVYDPALNPLYRDVLAHYGAVALPCRVRHPDRKGKAESSVGHTQRTPLRGMRFESLEDGQAYLDHWDTRWADTRIHGTTKRQVAAMFAEEQPTLQPLPLTPFRYYQYGTRVVHLDGCVEVDGAYYSAPPGYLGQRLPVQWDGQSVRLLDPRTAQLLREHRWQARGQHAIAARSAAPHAAPDAPPPRPRAPRRPRHRRTLYPDPPARWPARHPPDPRHPRLRQAPRRRRRGGGLRHRARARRPQLPVRPPLPRAPPAEPAHAPPDRSAHSSAHPLPRSHRSPRREGYPRMTLAELDRALRQLRLSGMADGLEARLRQAQAERLVP